MKKYFLKGKAYIHQKMGELEIQHTKLNLVAEQIPKKYHETFRVLQTTDIDLQSFEKYSLYYRTYPNHPIGPLLLQKVKQQNKVLQPSYVQQLRLQKNKIPMLDEDLQEKAYKLRNIVEGYSEGLPQEIDGLLGIGVVEFHHKRGAEIEFIYPKTEEVKVIFNSVVPFAMPDSSHNRMEDCSFFNLPFEIGKEKKMVYGVSYFKQIKVTEEMKTKNQSLTRSHLQKAVCILSFVPLFGQFRLRIMSATNLYFSNFHDFSPIINVYEDLKKSLKENWKNLSLPQLHIGLDTMGLLSKYKLDLLKIFKSILFNKRVIFYSQSPYCSGSAILSMLALFPGQLVFSMRSSPLDKYLEGLRQYALPLKIFSSQQPLLLSANIQVMGMLKSLQGGYVIGTSNQMLIESLNYDLLVDVDKDVLKWTKEQEQQDVSSKDDKIFLGVLSKVLNSSQQFGQNFLKDHFHNYLKKSLAKIADVRRRYNHFVSLCRSFEESIMYSRKHPKTENYKHYSTLDQEIKQEHELAMKVPQFDETLLDLPLIPLITKAHFRYFLEFSNPLIYLTTNKYYYEDFLFIDNYQYYMGDMPRSKSKYVAYNWKSKRLRLCNLQSNERLKMKQIKFNQNGEASELFIGDFDGNVYNGHGILLTLYDSYEGGFRNGLKDGFGKLVSPSQTYIGTFSEGLYHGDGHLVINQSNTVYVGMFKEGLKDGYGKLQTNIFYYEGEFSENLMSGNGSMTILQTGVKYFGVFEKNKLKEGEQESVITYPDGSVYTGATLDMAPHGMGVLHKQSGQLQEGEFENGRFHRKQES